MTGSSVISMRLSDEEYRLWSMLKMVANTHTWAGAARLLLDDPVIRGRINEMIDDYNDWESSPSH